MHLSIPLIVLVLPLLLWPQAFAQAVGDVSEEDCTTRGQSTSGCETIILSHERRLPALEVFGDRDFDVPGAFSAIDADEIARIDAETPAEILNTVPGANIQMNSGQENLIAIRSPVLTGGAGQGSVLIQENGVPIRPSAFGNVNALFETPFELATTIEVVRGPGSVRTGSNAVDGLINVMLPLPGRGWNRSARLSASSLSRYRADLGAVTRGETWRTSSGLSLTADGGWRDASGLQQQKGFVSAERALGDWTLTGWLSATNLQQETAGFLQGPKAYRDRDAARTNANPEAWRNASAVRAALRLDGPLGYDTRLVVTPYARWQDMTFIQHFLPYQGIETNQTLSAGMQSRLEWEITPAWTLRSGADLEIVSGDLAEVQERASFGPFPQGVHYDYTVETRMLALWGEATRAYGNWTFVLGLRGETITYDYRTRAPVGTFGRFQVTPDRTDDYSFLTPKLGVEREFDWGHLFLNLARGARAPQASDLYRLQSAQVPGEIDVETNDSVEIGLSSELWGLVPDLGFEIVAFASRKDNYFFRDADGLNVPNGATESAGVETRWDWRIRDDWQITGNLSWAEHTYAFDRPVARLEETIRSGTPVDTAPEWLADLSIRWAPDTPFAFSLDVEHVGAYFTSADNSARYPGHTVAHFRGSYEIGESHQVFFAVRNLLDMAYADRADFAFGNDRYFPGEPRSLTVGLRLRH
jgi:outer membrane receptor protein involved in Fe transport